MRILAIESALWGGSVALLESESVVDEVLLPSHQRTAQSLAPAIRDLLRDAHWNPHDVRLVAVSQGPGSFTGLRIGITTAKTFAYAVKAEALGIDTLAVLAAQTPHSSTSIWAVMNAERNQLYAARFRFATNGWVRDVSPHIVDSATWVKSLVTGESVTGPALVDLRAHLPRGIVVTPEDTWLPRAATVGQLAWRGYRDGQRETVWSLLPTYIRPCAAVEKVEITPAS